MKTAQNSTESLSTPGSTCPCGSQKSYDSCCGTLIKGKAQAATPEALLRSRYSAFVKGEIDYILATHDSETRDQVKKEEIESWSKESQWLGLEVLQIHPESQDGNEAVIDFTARYETGEKTFDHTERSTFRKKNGRWFFHDAQELHIGPYRRVEPKVGRNDPCPCGSGKKFKKCHGNT
jgi:SEC-C motif-containing protein